jgi:hypothetical protein
VIHYNDNSWNNNNGQDFHITVSGGSVPESYVMDGAVDTSAAIAATSGTLTLYLGWNGVQLYAATQSAQSQAGDMFIIVADSQRALTNAMWAKSGSVAAWGAFLGNESTNNWNGWFNSTGAQITGNGVNTAAAVLEGALNVQAAFGRVPATLYLAVGKYATADGGALQAQVPAGNGNGNIEAGEFFAFAIDSALSAPPAPIPVFPSDQEIGQPLALTLTWTPSSGATSYGVQMSADSTFAGGFVVNEASIPDTFRAVSGLSQLTRYHWRVRARNIGGTSAWSSPRVFTTLPGIVVRTVPFNAEWNMLSNPVNTQSDSVLQLFPLSLLSYGFAFDPGSGYTQSHRLAHGRGYWMKFGSAGTAGLTGQERTADTVAVGTGWNMIGSVSAPVAASGITTNPPAILASDFYSYDGSGYAAATMIQPGNAYWVKTSAPGVLYLASSPAPSIRGKPLVPASGDTQHR